MKEVQMTLNKLLSLFLLTCFAIAQAADEWTFIGMSENGYKIYATSADGMPDGSLRMFLRAEKLLERPPEGVFAMFKKPEKYMDKTEPFAVLVNCRKKAVRDYVAGSFGSEFYLPWQPATPGSYGAAALNAFCRK